MESVRSHQKHKDLRSGSKVLSESACMHVDTEKKKKSHSKMFTQMCLRSHLWIMFYMLLVSTSVINAGSFKPTSSTELQNAINKVVDKCTDGGQGRMHDIRSEEDFQKLQSTGHLVVANFCATFSGPCNRFKETFQKLAEEYADVLFCTIDVDEMDELAGKHEINAVPTFKVSCRCQKD